MSKLGNIHRAAPLLLIGLVLECHALILLSGKLRLLRVELPGLLDIVLLNAKLGSHVSLVLVVELVENLVDGLRMIIEAAPVAETEHALLRHLFDCIESVIDRRCRRNIRRARPEALRWLLRPLRGPTAPHSAAHERHSPTAHATALEWLPWLRLAARHERLLSSSRS